MASIAADIRDRARDAATVPRLVAWVAATGSDATVDATADLDRDSPYASSPGRARARAHWQMLLGTDAIFFPSVFSTWP